MFEDLPTAGTNGITNVVDEQRLSPRLADRPVYEVKIALLVSAVLTQEDSSSRT